MKGKKNIARFLLKPALEALGGPCAEWRGKVRLLAHDILKKEMMLPVVQHIRGCAACRLFYLDCMESRSSFVKSVGRAHAADVAFHSMEIYFKAERFRRDGALGDAITEYKKAIALDLKNISAYRELAETLNAQGKYMDGLEIMKRAVHLNPSSFEANLNLRSFLKLHGKLADGLQVWREAYDIAPRTDWAYEFLGKALESKGLYKEAVRIYEEVVQKKDEAFAHGLLADAYAALGMSREAVAEYKKAIEKDSDNLVAFYKIKLSRFLVSNANYKAAEIVARDAVSGNPKNYSAHANLGEFLRLHGSLAESIAEYRKAIRINPESVWAQKGLSLALQKGDISSEVSGAMAEAMEKELAQIYESCGR